MKFPLSFMTLAGSALIAAPAMAQTAPQTTPAPTATPAQSTTPAPSATTDTTATTTTTAATPVTDAEVQQFARAALDVERIRTDATIPAADKNARYVAAIQASGLKAVRFNEIANAMQADQMLNQRIQKAGMALTASSEATTGAATADASSETTTDE